MNPSNSAERGGVRWDYTSARQEYLGRVKAAGVISNGPRDSESRVQVRDRIGQAQSLAYTATLTILA